MRIPLFLAAANLEVLFWVAILLGVTISGSLVILSMRKRLFAPQRDTDDPGTLMEQMRVMERRGEITKEEFDRVRRRLVDQASGKSRAPERENDKPPAPTNDR